MDCLSRYLVVISNCYFIHLCYSCNYHEIKSYRVYITSVLRLCCCFFSFSLTFQFMELSEFLTKRCTAVNFDVNVTVKHNLNHACFCGTFIILHFPSPLYLFDIIQLFVLIVFIPYTYVHVFLL